MEEGVSYAAEFDILGTRYSATAVPFLAGKEWRFRVTIQPGNMKTIFQYAQSEDHDGLAAAERGIVPEPLEEMIGDWIEQEDS
jgi:hypothetical protein